MKLIFFAFLVYHNWISIITAAPGIFDDLKDNINGIKDNLSDIKNQIKNEVEDQLQNLDLDGKLDGISDIISDNLDKVVSNLNFDELKQLVEDLKAKIRDADLGENIDEIKNKLKDVFDLEILKDSVGQVFLFSTKNLLTNTSYLKECLLHLGNATEW